MSSDRSGAYTVVDVGEIEPQLGGRFRFVRRELGATAFGVNQIELAPGQEGREHDELDSGQEEVYVVLTGGGAMRVDDEEIELVPGRFLLVQPAARRLPVAGPDGLVFVAVGAPPGAYAARGPF
jgi:quercetin dioxygenase-like cupin family protein